MLLKFELLAVTGIEISICSIIDYIISLVALLNILLIYLGKCIGFEAVPEETEIKNPLLVFSKGFGNDGKWEKTNMLLFEVKGKN